MCAYWRAVREKVEESGVNEAGKVPRVRRVVGSKRLAQILYQKNSILAHVS